MTTRSTPTTGPLIADDPPPHGFRAVGLTALLYGVLSIGLWWGVWSAHPSSTTTCGCGDAARFLWFFEWPAFALSHGHSVWFSTWLFHPTGINLLNDTSVLALGIVLSPATLLFGPVLSMNVALTMSPVLSALAMFVLVRRWVRWTPAAFVGGLFYGFSPFVITELAYNQLNIAFLVIPPLVVAVLDELLIRQRRSPYRSGSLLALLLVIEFFVSTEMLLVMVIVGAIGMVVTVSIASLRRSREQRASEPSQTPTALHRRIDHAARALTTTLGVGAVMLAYPMWFFLRGPAHLSGPIWSNGALDRFGNVLTSLWNPPGSASLVSEMHHFGGYQGVGLPNLGYLGAGTVIAVVGGTLVWRRNRQLLLFGAVALVSAALSLGPGHGYWVPWQAFEKIPWVTNIVEIRFSAITTLCVTIMLAIVVDRSYAWASARQASARPTTRRRSSAGSFVRQVAGVLAGAAVAVVALVPTLVALWPNLPLTTQAVVLPRWFAQRGTGLPPGQVVLAYPAPFSGIQAPMAWQALDHMRFAMAGGGGPEGEASRAGKERPGFQVLFGASLGLGPPPLPTAANLEAVDNALVGWQVTTVVVPDQPGLPSYDQGRGIPYAVGLFTAALGRQPIYWHSAWVWSSIRSRHAPVPITIAQRRFDTCTAGPMAAEPSPLSVPDCILAASG